MNKSYILYIFDCDGTLTATKSGETFRKSADDWKLLPGRKEKLKVLKAQGSSLCMATNQGGVAFGLLDQNAIMLELHKTAKQLGMPPGGVYISYTHPKAKLPQYKMDDDRRKPRAGMLLEAMDDFDVEAEDTIMVGDRPEDEEAAKAAKIDFMWAKDFFGDQE